MPSIRRRLALLSTVLSLMLAVAGCGGGDDSVEPGERGDSPSAVGEPGNEESETGGGAAPPEGSEDGSDEN